MPFMTANKVFQTITTCVEVDRSLPPSSTPLNYEQRLKKQVLKSDAEKSEEKLQVFADKLVLAAKKRAWRKVASLLDVLERVRGKLNGNQGVSSIINRPSSDCGSTLLYYLCDQGARLELVTRALKLGAKQSISTPNKKHRTAIDAANNPYIKTKDTICIQQILAANKARLSFDSTIEASFQSPVTEEVPDSLKPYQHQDTEQDFIYKLGRQLNVGDWYGIELNLRKLKRYLGVFGKATVASIVNRKFVNHIEQEKERKLFRSQHNQAETLLSHAIRNKGTENVISLLVGLGADLYRETSDIRKEEMQDFFATLTLEAAPYAVTMKNDASYLGLAMTYNRPDVIKILAKAGIDIHKKDASGNNLLHSYVKSLHVHIEVIDALLELGVDKNALNDAGQSPLNLFLRSIRTPEEIKLLLKKGLKAFIEKDAGDQDSSNATVEITKDTIIEFLDLKPDRLSVLSAAKLFLKTGDILITSKLLEITDTARKQLDTNTDYLTDFLPQILFDYPPGLLNNFAYMFESKAFSSKTPLGEEILLAALNHPKDPKLENEAAQFITAAITSISRFMMHDLKATGRKVSNWKQFGLNTFSHGFFKHDCRRRKYIDPDTGKINFGPSLVQEYGMQLVINRASDFQLDDKGEAKPWLGSGYALLPGAKKSFEFFESGYDEKTIKYVFDSKTFIEIRQSWFTISHPEFGTIIFRNSSRDFGKDLLKRPVYWSPQGINQGFSAIDLLKLTPEKIESSFFSYTNIQANKMPDLDDKIANLLIQWRGFRADYRRWKFDTDFDTAWMKDLFVGGEYSEGFKATVRFITDQHSVAKLEGRKSLSLEFVNPYYPPFAAYPFEDATGVEFRALKITDEVVEVLNKIIEGNATGLDTFVTGIDNFFKMGIEKQAELRIAD